jgi:hypothetical protein
MPTRYCSVLKYIQKNNKPFYEIIDELCADYLYRANNRETTYLLPNADLIKQIKEEKREEDALDKLKSLILKGKYTADSSGKVFNILNSQLDNIAELNKSIDRFNGELWGNESKLVYEYKSKNVPSATKPVASSKKGGAFGMLEMNGYGEPFDMHQVKGGDNTLKCRENLSEKLLKEDSTESYKQHSASLINYIKFNNEDVYESLCYVIDNDPLITWYLFMEKGKTENLLISNEIFNTWCNDGNPLPVDNVDQIYSDCFNVAKNINLGEINSKRTNLLTNFGNKVELPSRVAELYKNSIAESNYPEHLNTIYGADPLLKLLQDEVRFLNAKDNKGEQFFCNKEISQNLNMMVWKNQTEQTDLNLCNKELYEQLVKPNDFFMSGIVSFVNSQSFLYTPLSDEKHTKIEAAISGGSNIIYRGGALRKKQSKSKKLSLVGLVATIKSLDQDSIEELKRLI